METPTATPKPTLLTSTDIADRIAAGPRGHCNPVTVWRAIKRLKLKPKHIHSRNKIKLYTAAQAERIEQALRAPNLTADQKLLRLPSPRELGLAEERARIAALPTTASTSTPTA